MGSFRFGYLVVLITGNNSELCVDQTNLGILEMVSLISLREVLCLGVYCHILWNGMCGNLVSSHALMRVGGLFRSNIGCNDSGSDNKTQSHWSCCGAS